MLDHALAWAERGFRVFPLPEGAKAPPPLGWQETATSDPDTIKQVWSDTPHNIGVIAEGIVVDIDDKDGKCGSLDWDMQAGDKPATLTVGTPSGGRHLYYASDYATGQPNLTESINTRAAGKGYVLAPGSTTKEGEYVLLEDRLEADAPAWLVEHCQQRGESIDWDGFVELDTDAAVALAQEFLKDRNPAIEGKGGDLWTYKTACAVIDFGISADMCAELMTGWSDTCLPPWEPEELQKKCDSAWKNRRNKAGVKSPEIEFGGVNVPDIPVPTRSGLLWAGDQTIPINQQWLLWNKIPRKGVGLLVGRSGCGKTFLSLDIAKHLATEQPWFGEKTDERVGTVVLSAEGVGGLALRIKHLVDNKVIPVAATTVRGLRDRVERKAVEERIIEARDQMKDYGARLGFIIVDTITAAGLFENENDSTSISDGLNLLGSLSEAFDCFVMGVHHPPKVGTGPRGSYALYAGVDLVVEVFDQDEDHIVECTKSRDSETGWWGSYRLRKETVEPDFGQHGRDRTTMRVDHHKVRRGFRGPVEPSPENREKVIQAFDDVCAELKQPRGTPVPAENLDQRLKEIGRRNGKGSNYMTLTKCLKWMEVSGIITCDSDTGQYEVCGEGTEC